MSADLCAEAAADEGTPLLTEGHSTAFSSDRPQLPPVREGYGAAASAASRKLPPPQLDAAHLPGSSSANLPTSPENLIALNSPQESFIVHSRSASSLAGPSSGDRGKEKVTEAFLDLQRGWLNKEGALASRDENAAADLELLQRTFTAWRSLAAAQHVRRVSSAPGEVPLHESAFPPGDPNRRLFAAHFTPASSGDFWVCVAARQHRDNGKAQDISV